jgi:cyanate lyase
MLRYKAPLRNRISMADKKVNATKIQAALKGHKGIVTNVDEFHDRFYLIHGIYGHALKTLTMGDESYFRLNIPKESL